MSSIPSNQSNPKPDQGNAKQRGKPHLVTTFLFIYTLTMLMVAHFYLMSYYPGTEKTKGLFEAIAPIWHYLVLSCHFIVMPLKTMADALLLIAPKGVGSVFPVTDASDLLGEEFPGTLQWLDLIAIPFWATVFIVSLNFGSFLSLSGLGTRTNRLLERISTPKPPKAPEMVKVFVKDQKPQEDQITTAPQETPPQKSAYRNRLEKVKETAEKKPLELPFLTNLQQPEQQPQKEDWQSFREREGTLGMRAMLQDLKNENSRLQHQQQQLRSNFSKYFSPNVLEYLENHKMSFQQFNNHTCQVSVLFCDIRNFSAYSQTHTPEEVAAFLKEYFDLSLNVILNQYDGAINKLMGDGIMAYWGFPIPAIEHAHFATQAGLSILEAVDKRNARSAGLDRLEVGIGIATGEVLIGNVGSADFMDFTLIGTPVNLAARLDDANRNMGSRILISKDTHDALQGRVVCKDHGTIEIQGWQDGVRVFEPKTI